MTPDRDVVHLSTPVEYNPWRVLCGTRYWYTITADAKEVTCRRCLRSLATLPIPPHMEELAHE